MRSYIKTCFQFLIRTCSYSISSLSHNAWFHERAHCTHTFAYNNADLRKYQFRTQRTVFWWRFQQRCDFMMILCVFRASYYISGNNLQNQGLIIHLASIGAMKAVLSKRPEVIGFSAVKLEWSKVIVTLHSIHKS